MNRSLNKILFTLLLIIGLAVIWKLVDPGGGSGSGGREDRQRPVPVEVAEILRGNIEEVRMFSGTLEPSATLSLSSKVSGRVLRVLADLSDPVERDEVLIELEPDEFAQQLARAEAEVVIAKARVGEAENRLEITRRERERMQQLRERGISSAAAEDDVASEFLIRSAALDVARANLNAAESAVNSAELNLEETRIRARWSEGDARRIVAARTVEEGDTVSPGEALLTIVEIQPVRAVVFVPERDYGRLQTGQEVCLFTDAWPDRAFPARISRIAPVFREESRQARVEIFAENPDLALKPGMFIRAAISLNAVEDAVLVPAAALTRRANKVGVFTVNEETATADWQEVEPGIRDGDRVQILEPVLSGRVVTLGQQLISEGSTLILPEDGE